MKTTVSTPAAPRLQDLLNAVTDGVVAVGVNGEIIFINSAAKKLLQAGPDRAGRAARDVLPALRLQAALETGRSEHGLIHAAGARKIRIDCTPLRDETGAIRGAAAVLRDVTEEQRLQKTNQQLQEMKTLLENIIDFTQDAISVCDRRGRITLVNPAYSRLIGLNKEDVIGKLATFDIVNGESMHLKTLETLEPIRGIRLEAGPQGRSIIVNASPIIIGGKLKGSVAVAHDLSEIRRLTEEIGRMKSLMCHIQSRYTFEDIVSKNRLMQKAVQLAQKAAPTPAAVLLYGESGTGKELFAHAIHHASRWSQASFVRVNCAAIPEPLFESELFGYEEGSFTGARRGGHKGLFEEADGGTIFLDEIGEMPLSTQVKLLRALQEKEITRVGGSAPIPVKVRVIAATNRDLQHEVNKGGFRKDLFYRINVFPIRIPALRERLDELDELALFLLRKLNVEYGRNVQAISDAARGALKQYSWPGNVRELENILARGVINMSFAETLLDEKHLVLPHKNRPENGAAASPLKSTLKKIEHDTILAAIAEAGGNKERAAKNLNMSLRSIYYKLSEYKTEV